MTQQASTEGQGGAAGVRCGRVQWRRGLLRGSGAAGFLRAFKARQGCWVFACTGGATDVA